MIGLRVILGTGVEMVGREHAGWIVFCSIEHTGLQGAEHLSVAHGDAVAAHGVHGVDKQRVTHHANFLTFQISRRFDHFFGVQAARAAIHPAQCDHF